jgi:hypothetical protein
LDLLTTVAGAVAARMAKSATRFARWRHRDLLTAAAVLIAAGTVGGCVIALPTYNRPFDERVAIVAADPSSYQIVIEGSRDEPIEVPADGRTVVHFPVLPRECSTFFLGIRVNDRRVEARKIISVVRGGQVVKRLAVERLRKLPVDSDGYHRLRLRELGST